MQRFVRDAGRVWHVAYNEIQSHCSVSFDPKWHPAKVVERSNDVPDPNNRCTRRGCVEQFNRP